jgi:hypothetical protein
MADMIELFGMGQFLHDNPFEAQIALFLSLLIIPQDHWWVCLFIIDYITKLTDKFFNQINSKNDTKDINLDSQ